MRKIVGGLAALMCLSASVAGAASFDFNAMATTYKTADNGTNGKTLNKGQEGTFAQVQAFDPSFFVDGGITITDITAGTGQHAFFDGADSSGPAGLGVCSSGFDGILSECSSAGGDFPGDDNVTGGTVDEEFTLIFDQLVEFTSLQFKNATHKDLTGTVEIDGASYDVVSGAISAANLLEIGSGTSFNFKYNGSQFYLSAASVAAVPVPAAGFLMLGGLAGLAGLRKLRKSARA